MKRRAVIIGSPGLEHQQGYLPGVKQDVANFINFLTSSIGGGWFPSEITYVYNPSSVDIQHYIKNIDSDFSLVYYSGHGSSRLGGTYLNINPKEQYSINNLATNSKKQLIIIDACRTFVPPRYSEFLGETLTKAFSSSLNLEEARVIYDSKLAECENGIVICFSCSENEASIESTRGGYFTCSLLDSSREWAKSDRPYSVLPINIAFNKTKIHLKNNYFTVQNPIILGEKRQYWFPFSVKNKDHLI